MTNTETLGCKTERAPAPVLSTHIENTTVGVGGPNGDRDPARWTHRLKQYDMVVLEGDISNSGNLIFR